MITVDELLEQHRKCVRAKNALDEVDILYPDGLYKGLSSAFYDSALAAALAEGKKMKNMMARATPDVIAETRRRAQEEK